MSDKTRRRFLTVAATGAATAVAGCSGGSTDGDAAATDTRADGESGSDESSSDGMDDSGTTDDAGGGDSDEMSGETLRLASGSEITSMDPVVKGNGGINQWAETLMRYDNGTLPPITNLAADYEISDDGTTYRFELKEGVTFHDGSELTASDIVYCWERLAQSPKTQNNDDMLGGTFTVAHEKDKSANDPETAELSDYVPGSLAVRAPETHVFEFDVEAPFHAGLAQIASESAFVVYPENTVGDIEREGVETDGEYGYQEAFGTENGGPKVAGTGPFQIETWSKGSKLVMTRHDDYHGTEPNVERIESVILSDENAVYKRALNGNVDVFGIPSTKFDPASRSEMEDIGAGREVGRYTLENGTEVNTAEVGDVGVDTILFNCDKVPKPVRQAFALMLNQDDIAANLYPDQEPAYSMVPPSIYPSSLGDFDSPAAAYEAHTTEGAMAQTSWGSDGYVWGRGESRIQEARQKVEDADLDGEEYTFTIAKDPVSSAVGSRVQQKAKALGITVNVERADYGTLISKGVFEKQLDFYTLGDSAEWPESDNLLRFYHPNVSIDQASQWGERTENGEWATEYMATAADAWQNNYVPHRGPGEENQRKRDMAYLATIETNWQVVQQIPLAIRVNRTYWTDDLDYTPPGVMGDKTYTDVQIDRS